MRFLGERSRVFLGLVLVVSISVSGCERLTGVPAGTAARIESAQAKERAGGHRFGMIGMTEALSNDEAAYELYCFGIDGWGRLTEATFALLEYWGLNGILGTEEDPARVAKLLEAQEVTLPDGVEVPDLGGVHWG